MSNQGRSPIRVAVWIHHGLGDVIMALPSLRDLDVALPDGSKMLFLVKSNTESQLLSLVEWKHDVETVVMNKTGRRLVQVINLALQVRAWRPDYFIAPHAGDGLSTAVFSRLVGAKISVGPSGKWSWLGFSDTLPYLSGNHKAVYYSGFFEKSGLLASVLNSYSGLSLRLPAIQGVADFVADHGRKFLVFSPGSGPVEAHKRWPGANYTALVEKLLTEHTDLKVLVMGSPNELDLLQAITQPLSENVRDRCATYAPAQLAEALAIIRQTAGMVCGCSGSGHMAALAGIPIVGIYGPTNHTFTGPFATNMRVVRMAYSCSPCYRPDFMTGCGDAKCIKDISVERVYQAVMDNLNAVPFPVEAHIATTHAIQFSP